MFTKSRYSRSCTWPTKNYSDASRVSPSPFFPQINGLDFLLIKQIGNSYQRDGQVATTDDSWNTGIEINAIECRNENWKSTMGCGYFIYWKIGSTSSSSNKLQGHRLHPSVIMSTVTTPRYPGSAWDSLSKIQGRVMIEEIKPSRWTHFPWEYHNQCFTMWNFIWKRKKSKRLLSIHGYKECVCLYMNIC